jgi:molybdenum cofactor cytidylyltransferase
LVADVCAIVLGAGQSARLGRPKQTLPFGGTTLLGWVVRDVVASFVDRVVVVIPRTLGQDEVGIAAGPAEVVVNEARHGGCSSSLIAGLNAAGACDAVMLILGDMPGVDVRVIDTMRDAWERHRPWAALASYQGRLGHPFVFSAEAFPALRELDGDKAVWKVVEAERLRIRQVAVDVALPLDVETWEDYVAVCHRFGQDRTTDRW